MQLVDKEILQAIKDGAVVIKEFDPRRLNGNSYDVTLGRHVYLLNSDGQYIYKDIGDQGFIFIPPRTHFLCSTAEVIGGKPSDDGEYAVNCEMVNRSTMARNFVDMIHGSGFGDVGYVQHWTMEGHNPHGWSIKLLLGQAVAQIKFTRVSVPAKIYGSGGHGNYHSDEKPWNHKDMLPKKRLW